MYLCEMCLFSLLLTCHINIGGVDRGGGPMSHVDLKICKCCISLSFISLHVAC